MAEFNPSNTIDSQLANLPPEYAAKIAQLLRQQQMSQMGMQMGLQGLNAPTQFTGGQANYAVKKSPFATLAQGLQMYLGQKGVSQADEGIAGVKKEAAEAQQGAAREMLGISDPSAQVAYGRASQWPALQKLAETLSKQAQERNFKVADVTKDTDPKTAVAAAMGTPVQPGWTPPELKQPESRWIDDPNNPGKKLPLTVNYDLRGQGKATLGAQGNNISVDARQESQELGAGLDVIQAQLKERQGRAQAAKETLSANTSALEALNAGAKTGGLEGYRQAARMVAQGFGVNLPETAPTAEVDMALGNAILAKARALAPVTGEDVKRLQSILGSINTDPQALMKMLSVYNGIALKELQDYNRYVESVPPTLKNPRAQDMFRGAGIGYEMRPPPGNTYQALRAIEELQKRGGDVSNFAVGGESMQPEGTPGATFNLPGTGVPQASIGGKLSPAEQAELDRLRKKYGR